MGHAKVPAEGSALGLQRDPGGAERQPRIHLKTTFLCSCGAELRRVLLHVVAGTSTCDMGTQLCPARCTHNCDGYTKQSGTGLG